MRGTGVECPRCRHRTDQNPCPACGYDFPDDEQRGRDRRISMKLKSKIVARRAQRYAELSDAEVIAMLKDLYASMYPIDCFGTSDLCQLNTLEQELGRRGYVIRLAAPEIVPYCKKCSGLPVEEYEVDLCGEHYRDQFTDEKESAGRGPE